MDHQHMIQYLASLPSSNQKHSIIEFITKQTNDQQSQKQSSSTSSSNSETNQSELQLPVPRSLPTAFNPIPSKISEFELTMHMAAGKSYWCGDFMGYYLGDSKQEDSEIKGAHNVDTKRTFCAKLQDRLLQSSSPKAGIYLSLNNNQHKAYSSKPSCHLLLTPVRYIHSPGFPI